MSKSSFGHINKQEKVVNIDCWLTIHPGDPKNWDRRPTVRVTAGEPALARLERAINLKMSLPLALFETPSIIARIDVDSPRTPLTIDTAAIAEAVKSAIGMDIDIRVATPEEQGD